MSLLSQKEDIMWPQKVVIQAHSLFKNDAAAQKESENHRHFD